MARALLIAEKNSVKTAVADYIKRKGFYDQIDCFQAQGHLIKMKEPNEYSEEWAAKWNFDVLPMVPENMNFKYKVAGPAQQKLINLIKEALKKNKYDYIVNACDPDREGEAIFWYIYNYLGCKLPVKRFWCNDMRDESIKEGLENFRTYNDNKLPNLTNLREAAFIRGKMDWLIGMNLSRAASLAMNYHAKIGRVKTVTLWIAADLEKRIKNFVKRTDYRIVLDWNTGKDLVECKHVEEEIDEKGNKKYTLITYEDKATAEYIQSVLNKNKEGKVVSITEEKQRHKPSKLYTLGDIQVEASSLYNLSVAESSDIMQKLYEAKITTYPRTKNPYLSTTAAAGIPEMLEACCNIPSLEKYAREVLMHPERIEAVRKNSRYINDKESAKEGHCAITPTGENFNWNSLTKEQQNVLEMVCQRFLAIFFEDGIDSKTTIILNSNDELFRTSFLNTVKLGYRKIYSEKEIHDDIPPFKSGSSFRFEEARLTEVVATPPKRLTDGTLIAALKSPAKYLHDQDTKMKSLLKETDGIGTEATRQEIIPQLVKDGYIEMKGKSNTIYVTNAGMKIIENLGDMNITSVDLTAQWESRLEAIRDGELSVKEVTEILLKYVSDNVEVFKNGTFTRINNESTEREIVGICPSCGGTVYAGTKAYYCEHYSKEPGGCQFVMSKVVKGGKISLKNMQKICKGEVSDTVKMTLEKDGQKFKTEKRFKFNPDSKKIEFYKPQITSLGECPCCGEPLMVSEKYVYCKNYGKDEDKCKVIFAKDFCGTKLSEEEIMEMVLGRESKEHTFTSPKSKKKFKAKLKYNSLENKLNFIFADTKENNEENSVGVCPCCGGKVIGPLKGQYGNFYTCSNKCGLLISEKQGGHKLTKSELNALISGKKTKPITMTSLKGTEYAAILFLNKETKKIEREFINDK